MKCTCGYELRLPGEQEMLDKWGCARTIERREGPFNSLQVVMCSSQGAPDPSEINLEDGNAFKDNFVQKYAKPDKPNGDKK